ncbi:MAG: TRAP transporter large permease [Clostridium sp.]|nr:TRAP transporter large permease [Clostridium sp.]
MIFVLVGAFLVFLFMGVPIAYILGLVAVIGISQLESISIITVVQKMFSGLNSFTLLAVPLFILAANIMNRAKISNKLIEFCNGIVGRFPGGLAYANVLVSMMFAGISGSSQADTAGIGSILIPAMEEEGYPQETAVGVTAASSTVGIVIPPSIPMVVYSSVAGASIGALFLGGVVPGILIGLGQMLVIFLGNKKHHYPRQKPMSFKEFGKLALECLPPLLTPAIIIGGVIFGFCTATESAAIACVYATLLGVFLFKNLSVKDIKPLLYDTLRTSATSLLALATANALGQLISYYNVSVVVQDMFVNYFPYKWQFLLAVIAFYLFLGTFMDAIPAMILFVPVLMPVATAFGISAVQLGLIIVITLAVGQVTPPYGLCLLIAGRISGMSVQKSFMAVVPYIMVSVVVVIIIAFVPDIAFAIPKLLKPEWF